MGLNLYKSDFDEIKNTKVILQVWDEYEEMYRPKEYSRSEIIQLHRDMWKYIADELENFSKTREGNTEYPISVYGLKWDFIYDHNYDEVTNRCFLCEYAEQIDLIHGSRTADMCHYCPLYWGKAEEMYDEYYCEQSKKEDGLWWLCKEAAWSGNLKLASEIARIISNLPEITKEREVK